jgi:hypothetical protein
MSQGSSLNFQKLAAGGLERLDCSAGEFVQLMAKLVWSTASNYNTILGNIEAAVESGEWELAALQSRFSIHLGLRIKLLAAGHLGGQGFDALSKLFGTDSEVYTEALRLDEASPMTPREVGDYAKECLEFVHRLCDLPPRSTFPRLSSNESVRQFVKTMRDVTSLAKFLDVRIAWPDEDLTILEEILAKTQSIVLNQKKQEE